MNIPYVMKKCNTCGEWIVASNINFHKEKNGKYGLRGQCKKCRNEYKKEYYEENKDKKKEYYEENKDKIKEYKKEYYEKNKEYYKEYREKNKDKKKGYNKKYKENNPEKTFNNHNKRRIKKENQGRGITDEQYIECNNWFGWKCAYSGEKLKKSNNTYRRTLDHIVALDNEGLNEPWNIVPMRLGYNASKRNRIDTLTWYKEQEYFNEERLNKIVEWQIYAYEKWGGEEFGELILITDLLED